jgi:hypothetical protein
MHDFTVWYFSQLSTITLLTGVAAYLISCLIKWKSENALIDAVTRSATWSALPNGVAFLLCTADSTFVPKLADSSVAFFMGGIALVAVGMWDLKTLLKRDPQTARSGEAA